MIDFKLSTLYTKKQGQYSFNLKYLDRRPAMKNIYDSIISEIEKYSDGVHELKEGIDENTIQSFENQYNILIPLAYKNWLKLYNGGEFFALPVGTSFSGILGTQKREKGIFYLEDNFNPDKRAGIPNTLFVIGDLCDGELICFDLEKTTKEDGCVVLFDIESTHVVESWNGFSEWLKFVFKDGSEMFDYEGNDK